MNKKTRGLMQSAPFKFAPANGLAYFEDLGWRAVEVESVDAISGVATPAGSAQSGRQDLERRRPRQPSLTTSVR